MLSPLDRSPPQQRQGVLAGDNRIRRVVRTPNHSRSSMPRRFQKNVHLERKFDELHWLSLLVFNPSTTPAERATGMTAPDSLDNLQMPARGRLLAAAVPQDAADCAASASRWANFDHPGFVIQRLLALVRLRVGEVPASTGTWGSQTTACTPRPPAAGNRDPARQKRSYISNPSTSSPGPHGDPVEHRHCVVQPDVYVITLRKRGDLHAHQPLWISTVV